MRNTTKKGIKNIPTTEIVILHSPELLIQSVAQKKAKNIAKLQNNILNLSNFLPNQQHIYPDVSLYKTKYNVSWYIDTPLFYEERINARLTYNANKKPLTKAVHVNTKFSLSFDFLISDKEAGETQKTFIEIGPNRNFLVETCYFFDSHGHFQKILFTWGDIKLRRQPLLIDVETYYSSVTTKEDFKYVERVLKVLKSRLEDYLQNKNQYSRNPHEHHNNLSPALSTVKEE